MRNWRVNFVFILIILFGATIIGRLVSIQIFSHDFYKALAQGQQKFFDKAQGERGEIFLQDKEGNLYSLAKNIDQDLVFISPQEISGFLKKDRSPEEIAKILGEILNLKEEFILEKIKKSDSLYEVIKNKLTPEEVTLLKELNLPGVYLKKESSRYYPQETLASQVVGFLGGENIGQYGVEGYYNDVLEGIEKIEEKEKGPGGYFLKKLGSSKEKGANLILAIDYNVQFKAEKLLNEAKENFKIEGGQVLVGDPHSGKIIALANFPTFNPNQYQRETNFRIFKNGAIQKLFEPGSVLKPITFAAALQEQKITPQNKYFDEGFVKIGGYTIYNYDKRKWGEKTMTEVLEKSINTGAVFVERKLGHSTFLKYLDLFGFFEKTGIDLQGEIFSNNSELKKGYEINFATASFGQGIEMTPIQLFRAFSAIANGGRLIRPYIVEKINFQLVDRNEEETKNVISQQTASQLTAMLVNVTEHGFGKKARVPGYFVAGKTGTAQIPWSALGVNKAGYSEKTIQTFIGWLPAYNPRFLILVKLDNPATKTAEYSAAPIFQKLAKYIVDYYQIPPDYE